MFKPRRARRIVALFACLVPLLLAGCGGGGDSGGGGDGGGGGGGGVPPDTSGVSLASYYASLPPVEPQASGPDPLLGDEWHLDNIGQDGGTPGESLHAFPVWNGGNKGENVRIAIIDDAVETVHRDLAPNLAPGATWNYRAGAAPGDAPLPTTTSDDHGTSVTGIIVARDNNALGGAGVAPRAQFAAYNALATETNADIADALNRDLANNAIYNNSWGAPDDGTLRGADQSFVSAVRNGVATGRGGLGAVYVFPAGNGGCYLQDKNGTCQVENSNYDGYANQFGVMAVCAFDDNGRAPQYGEPGANVLVCGPSGNARSGITTTALKDSYRSDFSGTSASAPMVSGVAALILHARPDLSWRDVRLILAYSARKIDAGNPGWTTQTPGRAFNPLYGFGAADAQAAVARAQGWTTVGGSDSLKSCGPYTRGTGSPPGSNLFPIAIPDAPKTGEPAVLQDTAPVTDACSASISKIEFIEIRFSATHPYSGDLRIDLISPNNLVSRLADSRLCDVDGNGVAENCGIYANWPFGSVRHLDEPAAGNWTLRVSDRLSDPSAPAAGTAAWTGWSLRFWGR